MSKTLAALAGQDLARIKADGLIDKIMAYINARELFADDSVRPPSRVGAAAAQDRLAVVPLKPPFTFQCIS